MIVKKLYNKLKEKNGSGSIFILGIWIILFLFFFISLCLTYFKVRYITTTVRNEIQSETIMNIVSNYANTYHSVRESYATGYIPNNNGFSESLYNEIENRIVEILKLDQNGNGKYVKYSNNDDTKVIYKVEDISVDIYNPSLKSGEVMDITVSLDLSIPVNLLLIEDEISSSLKIKCKYIQKY